MSRVESAAILQSLGFLPEVEFQCAQTAPGSVTIHWFSAQPQPSDATLNAVVWSPAIEAQWVERRRNAEVTRLFPIRLGAIANNSTVTLADVGLGWELDANRHYAFRFVGAYTAAAATTGLSLAITGPAGPTLVRLVVQIAESATAVRSGVAAAYNTAVTGATSGGSTPLPFTVDGNLSTGATVGRLDLRFASEVTASQVSILSGSYGTLAPIA